MKTDAIICESFDLTESIRSEVNDKLEKIRQFSNQNAPMSVFISKTSDHTYSVIITCHLGKKDLEGKAEENSFHLALKKAKEHIIRHIVEHKDKRIAARHKGSSNSNPPEM